MHQDHKLTCAEEAESRVKVVKYRGDTWLDVKDTKIKVFYKYHNRQTVASCEYQGVALSGAGINHNIAAAVLKTEVQKYLEKELNTVPDEKKQAEAEADRQALVDMFVELARRDQVG